MGRKEGAVVSLSRRAWSPSNTMSPCTSVQSGVSIHPAVWPQYNRHGPKIGWGCALLSGGAGSQSNTKSPGPRPTSITGGIVVHPVIWSRQTLTENLGLWPFRAGGVGSPSNTMSARPRPTSVPSGILIYATVRLQWTWAENWGCAVFGMELPPHVTMYFGRGYISVPSRILIHAAVWPQLTWGDNWGRRSAPVLGRGQLGASLTQSLWGRGLRLYQVAC